MKKYLRISSLFLASTMLAASAYAMSFNTNQIANISATTQVDNFQVVKSVNDIKTFSSTGTSMFAVVKGSSNDDRIYGWGLNDSGQLGLGNRVSPITVPTLISSLSNKGTVSHITSTDKVTLIVMNGNLLYATGDNQYGQFANGAVSSELDSTFDLNYTFPGKITSISAGEMHVAAVVDNSALYTWGVNGTGQLGLGIEENVYVPQLVTAFKDVTLGKVVSGYRYSVIKATDAKNVDTIYVWGGGSNGELAQPDDQKRTVPTAITYAFPGTIKNYWAIAGSTFVTVLNGGLNEVYAWGLNVNGKLGIDLPTTAVRTPTKIDTWDPAQEIVNMVGLQFTTIILTKSNFLYSVGNEPYSGHASGSSKFERIKLVDYSGATTEFKDITSISICSDSAVAISNNQIYVWGNNDNGTFGNGTDKKWNSTTPYAVDTFGIPSELTNISSKDLSTLDTYTALNSFYNGTSIIIDKFKEYIDISKFPEDAEFTMGAKPNITLNADNKMTMKLTITANKSYSQPDGAKVIAPVDFNVTLTGFKKTPDSYINIKTVPAYINYTNIEKRLIKSDGMVDIPILTELSTIGGFPSGAAFKAVNITKVLTADPKKGNFQVDLIPTSYYEGGLLHTTTLSDADKKYTLQLNNLVVVEDAKFTLKSYDHDIFNINNIIRMLENVGSDSFADSNFNKLFETANFGVNNKFRIEAAKVSFSTYTASLYATEAYINGEIVNDWVRQIVIPGLTERPDSDFEQRVLPDNTNINLRNVKRLLGDGSTIDNRVTLQQLIKLNEFPSIATFKITNASVVGEYFIADIFASHVYYQGMLSTNGLPPQRVSFKLKDQVDSEISNKTVIPEYVNANNIVKLINPTTGTTDIKQLAVIFNVGNFHVDNSFTVTGGVVNNNTYTATVQATRAYIDGDSIPKKFDLKLEGLVARPDSKIKPLNLSPTTELNLTNIEARLGNGTGATALATMNELFDLSEFPAGTTFSVTMVNITPANKSVSVILIPSKLYFEGNAIENTVQKLSFYSTNLQFRTNSTFAQKTTVPAEFNLNNIGKHLNPSGNSVDESTFNKLFDAAGFGADNKFTIANAKTVGDAYVADINASHTYINGELVNHVFPVRISGLVARPDSAIKLLNIPTDINLQNVKSLLGEGISTNPDVLAKLIDLSMFPAGAACTISGVNNPVEDNSYTAKLTTTRYYSGGNVVTEDKEYPLVINNLKPRPNSAVITKVPPLDDIDRIFTHLERGGPMSLSTMDQLIDVSQFPDGTIFEVSSATRVESVITFSFTPSLVYQGGNIVDNINNTPQNFTTTISFVPIVPVAETSSLGLIIGLSVGGAVIILAAAAGLLLWYIKRRQAETFKMYDK